MGGNKVGKFCQTIQHAQPIWSKPKTVVRPAVLGGKIWDDGNSHAKQKADAINLVAFVISVMMLSLP